MWYIHVHHILWSYYMQPMTMAQQIGELSWELQNPRLQKNPVVYPHVFHFKRFSNRSNMVMDVPDSRYINLNDHPYLCDFIACYIMINHAQKAAKSVPVWLFTFFFSDITYIEYVADPIVDPDLFTFLESQVQDGRQPPLEQIFVHPASIKMPRIGSNTQWISPFWWVTCIVQIYIYNLDIHYICKYTYFSQTFIYIYYIYMCIFYPTYIYIVIYSRGRPQKWTPPKVGSVGWLKQPLGVVACHNDSKTDENHLRKWRLAWIFCKLMTKLYYITVVFVSSLLNLGCL